MADPERDVVIDLDDLQAFVGDLDEGILRAVEVYAEADGLSDRVAEILRRLGGVRLGLRGALDAFERSTP